MRLIHFVLCIFLLAQSHGQPNNLIHHMDSVMKSNMAELGVPGASYALVKCGRVIHINHFGYQDFLSKKQVDEQTLFMFGSIAKLITTVAVLQLYEQKKVSLEEDIRTYLPDFPVFRKVTLKNLLTHTAGFEETVFERVKLEEQKLLPFKAYMYKQVPELIFSPGTSPAYSNFGMSLAGLIVQEISGVAFEEYVYQNIFKPLQMDNSSFSLNDENKEDLATSYNQQNKNNQLEYVQTVPASMLIGTAADMGKFVAFQINGNERVLKKETLELMQAIQYKPHPSQWGRSFGFFEKSFRSVSLLEHGGSRNGFFSNLVLSPYDSLGLVVVVNGGDQNFRSKVTSEFLKSNYPKKRLKKSFSNQRIDLKEFEGTYYSNRRIESNFGRLFLQAVFVEKLAVRSSSDKLYLLGFEYSLQSPDQFDISSDSSVTFPISFGRDERGNVNQLFLPGRSDSYSKLKWYENEKLALIIFFISLIVFAITMIRNFRYSILKKNSSYKLDSDFAFKTYASVYSLLNLLFVLCTVVAIVQFGQSFQYKLPSILYVILSLGLIGLPLLVVLFLISVRNKIRLMNGIFLAVALIYTALLYQWNLLGFHF